MNRSPSRRSRRRSGTRGRRNEGCSTTQCEAAAAGRSRCRARDRPAWRRSAAYAAGLAPVGLGSAATFAVLAGTPAVTNSGSTIIDGDIGIFPAAAVAGVPPGTLNGAIHAADTVAQQAQVDLATAYDDAAGRTPAVVVAGGALGGMTLVAGVYNAGGRTLDLTGVLTLDGQNDPS